MVAVSLKKTFFQAEDGIRDVAVTGVQTCALPIFASQLIQDQLHHRIKVIDKDGEIHIFGQTHDIKVIVKALVQADIDVDEIYYARQDLEKFFTDLVD